jgi:hypothetical protein
MSSQMITAQHTMHANDLPVLTVLMGFLLQQYKKATWVSEPLCMSFNLREHKRTIFRAQGNQLIP